MRVLKNTILASLLTLGLLATPALAYNNQTGQMTWGQTAGAKLSGQKARALIAAFRGTDTAFNIARVGTMKNSYGTYAVFAAANVSNQAGGGFHFYKVNLKTQKVTVVKDTKITKSMGGLAQAANQKLRRENEPNAGTYAGIVLVGITGKSAIFRSQTDANEYAVVSLKSGKVKVYDGTFGRNGQGMVQVPNGQAPAWNAQGRLTQMAQGL